MSRRSGDELVVRDHGHLRSCTLARVNRRNALSLELCRHLEDAVESAGADIALITIGHEGDTFSSGADLKEIAPALTRDDQSPRESATLSAIRELFASIEQSEKPVVAAVDGRCLAGGLELALACDLIVASRAAHFFDGHLAGGLLPGGGAAIRLPERIGPGRAFRFLVEGVELDADQALSWGLIDLVVEDAAELATWVEELAARLGAHPPGLAGGIKRQLSAAKHPRAGKRFAAELEALEAYVQANRPELRRLLARHLPQSH